MADAVQDDLGHGAHAVVAFAAGFIIDGLGQAVGIIGGVGLEGKGRGRTDQLRQQRVVGENLGRGQQAGVDRFGLQAGLLGANVVRGAQGHQVLRDQGIAAGFAGIGRITQGDHHRRLVHLRLGFAGRRGGIIGFSHDLRRRRALGGGRLREQGDLGQTLRIFMHIAGLRQVAAQAGRAKRRANQQTYGTCRHQGAHSVARDRKRSQCLLVLCDEGVRPPEHALVDEDSPPSTSAVFASKDRARHWGLYRCLTGRGAS